MELISSHARAEIRRLCAEFDVEVLELFGSAARGERGLAASEGGTFRAEESDFDFLVAFGESSRFAPGRQYLGLLEGLKGVMGREVDLVDVRAVSNPYFIAEAVKHRVRIYAA